MEHHDEQLPHEEWETQAVLAALGGLEPSEHEEVRNRLRTCATCRRAYAEGRQLALGLAHTVPLVEAPSHLEADLRARLRAARPPLTLPPRRSVRRREPAWWLAVAALLVALVAGGQSFTLRRSLAEERATQEALRRSLAEERTTQEALRRALNEERTALEDLRRTLATEQAAQESLVTLLAAQDVRPIALESTTPAEQTAHASLLWAPTHPTATLVVEGLAAPAPGRAYQLWLIRPDGSVQSGGLFGIDPQGRALLDVTPDTDWDEYAQLGITEEPAAGSPTPTTPVLLAGEF